LVLQVNRCCCYYTDVPQSDEFINKQKEM
jgi:hypothetical protein